MKKINLYLPDDGTWVCFKNGELTDTLVRGMALEVELTDGIKNLLEKYEGSVVAVECTSELRHTIDT